MRRIATRVLVVGGGPVGTTLAMDLAWRGIDVVVAEQRHRGELPSVKCNHVAARTMEIFRRLGVAQRVRDAGLPHDHANDVAFRTTTTGIEFARIPIPCRRDRYTVKDGPDGWWPTPEPPHRINQIYLEPVLVEFAAAMPGLRYLNRIKVLGFTQTEDAVTAEAQDLDTGETLLITADYLIGCDGPSSEIRRQIGARLTGDRDDQSHAIDLHPRAVADQDDAGGAGMVHAVAEPAAQRQHVRRRWPRDLADPQLPAPG